MTDTLTAPAPPTAPLRTSIGKKAVMAVTGFVMLGFVVAHMAGNLKFFLGEEHLDEYTEFLRRVGEPLVGHSWLLWALRSILFVSVVLHMWAAWSLSRQSRLARPVRYAHTDNVQSTYASRTMRWGGVILLLFIIYHLMHMTFGTVHPDFHHGAVYDNAIAGFEVPIVTIAYTVAMAALGLHIFHGFWSAFQTLGRNSKQFDSALRSLSLVLSLVIVFGFLSVPWAVLLGVRP